MDAFDLHAWREISDNGTVSIGAVKEEERAAFALFCLGEETRSDVGRPSLSPVRCPAVYFRPSVTWKRTDTDLPEFYVSKRVIVLVGGVSHAPLLAPFSITAAAILAKTRFRRECRRHASPKNFLRARRLGSAKWIRLGGASSGLPKRHSPLTFRFAFSPLPFLLFPRFSSLPAPADIQWWR